MNKVIKHHSTIVVFKTQNDAAKAMKTLEDASFDMRKVSKVMQDKSPFEAMEHEAQGLRKKSSMKLL